MTQPGPSSGDQAGPGFDESTDDIYETAPCAQLSVSPHEVIVKVNQTFLSWTGYEREEVIGRKRFGDILPRAGQIFHQSRLVPLLRLQGFVNEVALDILCKDGERLSVFVSAMQKKDAGGHLVMTRFTLFSANVRRQYENALLKAQKDAMLANARLHEQEERLRITLNSIGDGVIATDIEGNITYLNPAASRMTGWSEQDAIGLPLPQVFHVVDEDNGRVAPNLAALVLNEKPVPALDCMTLISKTGERFAIKDTATPIRDPSNRINGVVLVIRDISKERELAAEITYQATHDALTGLVNRREFHHRLDMALQLARVDGHQHSLLYIDLDQFKIVNDTCGHSAGDELLRQLSTVMRAQLRPGDTVARLGGDEFGVLLPYCPRDAALEIADSIRESIKEFDFVWANNVFPIGASIGLVTCGNDGATAPDLLRMADAACYVAKDMGRNRIHMYAEDDRELERRKGEMGWAARLQRALNDQRFVLYSQKIVALQSDDASQNHFEVLVRLLDEAGNLVPPSTFIPAAERYGLMPQIDRWVITTALHWYARHAAQAGSRPLCAINLSGTTISDDGFLSFLRAELERHQVPPEGLCFEITETAAVGNLAQAAALMGELKAMGSRIALDDFGSGMSSFAYLKHLPVDYLKIDGDFVKDITEDRIDRAMVESINHIGHVMGIRTVAEFAESDDILQALREIGVDYAQGHAVQSPVPL
jgi:diguanylate cyclase (GGDEF)-like protein/PAS domain S-box-containing protein